MVLKRSSSSFIFEDELRDLLTYKCPYTGENRCPPCSRENNSMMHSRTMIKIFMWLPEGNNWIIVPPPIYTCIVHRIVGTMGIDFCHVDYLIEYLLYRHIPLYIHESYDMFLFIQFNFSSCSLGSLSNRWTSPTSSAALCQSPLWSHLFHVHPLHSQWSLIFWVCFLFLLGGDGNKMLTIVLYCFPFFTPY